MICRLSNPNNVITATYTSPCGSNATRINSNNLFNFISSDLFVRLNPPPLEREALLGATCRLNRWHQQLQKGGFAKYAGFEVRP
jgi:hypothetical protein